MNYIGLDLGQTSSQICCLTSEGELIEKRIKTERESLAQFFGRMPRSRILVTIQVGAGSVVAKIPSQC